MAGERGLRIVNLAERTFALEGDFDLTAVPSFMHTVGEAAAQPGDLLLNMEEVGFLDSTAIAALLSVSRWLQGDLILFKPTEYVLRVLRLVGIDQASNIRITEAGGPDPAPADG